ncbi:39S ribosomal protein L51, mitochondrial [Dispira simplex]|nr:39S ribosomal protein L51, mitochondrial [Dispira simplex]
MPGKLRPVGRALFLVERLMKRSIEVATRQPAPFRNGVGAFVYPCRKLVFNYCERGGSSRGMQEYLTSGLLEAWARDHPQVEVQVEPVPSRHPKIRGFFVNGNEKTVCARKLTADEVAVKVKELTDTSGKRDIRYKKPVISDNPSVRGIWSPFHSRELYKVLANKQSSSSK